MQVSTMLNTMWDSLPSHY